MWIAYEIHAKCEFCLWHPDPCIHARVAFIGSNMLTNTMHAQFSAVQSSWQRCHITLVYIPPIVESTGSLPLWINAHALFIDPVLRFICQWRVPTKTCHFCMLANSNWCKYDAYNRLHPFQMYNVSVIISQWYGIHSEFWREGKVKWIHTLDQAQGCDPRTLAIGQRQYLRAANASRLGFCRCIDRNFENQKQSWIIHSWSVRTLRSVNIIWYLLPSVRDS
jgi:hypothetical protein